MVIGLGMPRVRPTRADALRAAADRPDVPGLLDRFDRVATDLRVSLTDRCNLRCTYCMPAEGLPAADAAQTMSRAEVVRLVRIAVRDLGVRSIRLTGGEPLLRHDLAEIIADIAALDPRPEIALTTNAIGLRARARELAGAGLDRANVSLDSLDEETFTTLARRPFLRRTLEGIQALRDAGIGSIKVNSVLVAGINDHEAPDLLAWALERDLELRFIEQMPIGADPWDRGRLVTAARTRELLSERFELRPHRAPREGAPAERWWVHPVGGGAALGTVGIIASVTEPFCGDCTRTRLTADGSVRSCLFARSDVPLLDLLRAGADDQELATVWRAAMWAKQSGHGMALPGFTPPARTMSAIGG